MKPLCFSQALALLIARSTTCLSLRLRIYAGEGTQVTSKKCSPQRLPRAVGSNFRYNPSSLTERSNFRLTRAKSESSYTNRHYVVKRLSPTVFEQSLEHEREFPDTRRLRMHIDYNEKELTLVYEYFKDNLLSLAKNNPNFPLRARKQIL